MRYLYTILIAMLFMTGCSLNQSTLGPAVESDMISLTWKESVQVEYDPATYQLGYDSRKNEYRVYDDRLSYWFTVTCSEKPVTGGQTLTADVVWTAKNKMKSLKGLKFEVTKTDDTGMVWLWNQANKISIVLKNQ